VSYYQKSIAIGISIFFRNLYIHLYLSETLIAMNSDNKLVLVLVGNSFFKVYWYWYCQ